MKNLGQSIEIFRRRSWEVVCGRLGGETLVDVWLFSDSC